ncbi:MAG: hypothetical protein AAF587_04960 [Bacteroidota bacterium]
MNNTLDVLNLYHLSLQRDLNKEEAAYLDKILDQYPYFSLAHYLKAKYLADEQNIFFASSYSVNRTQLKQYLKGNSLLFAPEVAPTNMMVDPPKSSSAHSAQGFDLFSLLEFSPETSTPSRTDELFEVYHPEKQEKESVLLQVEIRLRVVKYIGLIQDIQAQLLADARKGQKKREAQMKAARQQRKSTASLIDRFLTQIPQKRKKADASSTKPKELPQAQSSIEHDEEMVTETLALLHLKQNNRKEALRIYQKLRLRFPGKKAYFDAQIEKITHS